MDDYSQKATMNLRKTLHSGLLCCLALIGAATSSCSNCVQKDTAYQLDSTQYVQILTYLKQDSALHAYYDSTDRLYESKLRRNALTPVDLAVAWRDYRLDQSDFRGLTQQEWLDFFAIPPSGPEQIKRSIEDSLENLWDREVNYQVKINHDWVRLSPGYDTHLVIFFTRVNPRVIQTHIFPKMYYDDDTRAMYSALGQFPIYTFFFDKEGKKIVKTIFGMVTVG
jgi:hypothetical protein